MSADPLLFIAQSLIDHHQPDPSCPSACYVCGFSDGGHPCDTHHDGEALVAGIAAERAAAWRALKAAAVRARAEDADYRTAMEYDGTPCPPYKPTPWSITIREAIRAAMRAANIPTREPKP